MPYKIIGEGIRGVNWQIEERKKDEENRRRKRRKVYQPDINEFSTSGAQCGRKVMGNECGQDKLRIYGNQNELEKYELG